MALLLAAIVCAGPAKAQNPHGCELPAHGGGKVASVVDGNTLELEDKTRVRLAGADVPGEAGIAKTAAATLAELAVGRPVSLHYSKERIDRHRRRFAQVRVNHQSQSYWLQGELLRRGLARAYSFKDNQDCIQAMLAREEEARRARRGLWAEPRFAVRQAGQIEALLAAVQTFQIVEGRVRSTGRTRRNAYLNFGRHWKHDFTGIIAARDLDQFEQGGMTIEDLTGSRVRLRGWIVSRGGPAIELTHPAQLEILDR